MKQKSVAQNSMYKATLNIFNLIIPLVVTPYITGLLTEELYGAYNRVFNEFSTFLVIGAFGIYNYGLREISKARNNPEKKNKIFTSLFVIGLISNIIMLIGYITFAVYRSTSNTDIYIYMTMIIQIVAQVFYIVFVNEANEDYAFITKKTIIIRLIYLVSIFIFVRKPTDIIPYSIVVSMTILLNNIFSYFYLKKSVKFDFKGLKIVIHLTPLFVAFLMTNVEILYATLDKWMLGGVVGDISVTEYFLPTNLVGMIAAVPLALISVAIPRLSSYIGNEEKYEYEALLNKTINNYMLIVIPMALGIGALAQEIMQFFSQGKYTYIFPILIAAAFMRIIYGFQSIVVNLVMYVNSLEKPLTLFMLIFGIVNLVANTVLIVLKIFTPMTALITTAIAILMFTIVGYVYTRTKLKINYNLFTKEIIGYFLVSMLFFPISWAVRALGFSTWPTVFIVMGICVPLYVIYLAVTRDTFFVEILEIIKRKIKK